MLKRHISSALLRAARENPVVTLTGPRQSGKTTLCRNLFPSHEYISLEAPDILAVAKEDPRGLLDSIKPVILDEIQRSPELLSYIQVLVDEEKQNGRFILIGSQNVLRMESVSQSLAGRTAILHLYPLSVTEILIKQPFHPQHLSSHSSTSPNPNIWETLFKGFYPGIHDQQLSATEWFRDYFRTYVDRDLREVLTVSDLRTFENFVRLAAASTATEVNLSRLSNDIGVRHQTIQRWLNALEIGFLATTLPVHHANFRKTATQEASPALLGFGASLLFTRNSRSNDFINSSASRRDFSLLRRIRNSKMLRKPPG